MLKINLFLIFNRKLILKKPRDDVANSGDEIYRKIKNVNCGGFKKSSYILINF